MRFRSLHGKETYLENSGGECDDHDDRLWICVYVVAVCYMKIVAQRIQRDLKLFNNGAGPGPSTRGQ